jgi:hypothetical protein
MRYVLDEPAREEEELTGYGLTVKDKGHERMRLADFLALPEAMAAKLDPPHVAALRVSQESTALSVYGRQCVVV